MAFELDQKTMTAWDLRTVPGHPRQVEVDLHGYHPDDVALDEIVKQAWAQGATKLTIIHGHGRNRGISPGFVKTNTGYFGLRVRDFLRNDPDIKSLVKRSTLEFNQCRPPRRCVAKRNLTSTRRSLLKGGAHSAVSSGCLGGALRAKCGGANKKKTRGTRGTKCDVGARYRIDNDPVELKMASLENRGWSI
jgi:hypothetical protein